MSITIEPGLRVDVPLLRKALDHITAHPEEWRQSWWVSKTDCGTACCLAGHVALMTGHEINWQSDVWRFARGEDVSTASTVEDGRHIALVAQEELGLNDSQQETLFHAQNSLSELWHLASRFTNGEIEIPEAYL